MDSRRAPISATAWTSGLSRRWTWLRPISHDERDATALVSVDDAGKLWVNGELVWAVPGVNHVLPDKYAVPIRLRKGTNEVLIKAGQGGGAWGVAFRIADPKGDLQYTPTRP